MNLPGPNPYRALLDRLPGAGYFREPGPVYETEVFQERHLQCLWYDDKLRPGPLYSSAGERIRVDHPGQWNLEAGPDFLDAIVRVGDTRTLAGDVEIHIRPGDYIHHGHDQDPRYRNVKLHVTFQPGTLPEGTLPPGTVEVFLQDALRLQPDFSFERIDLLAYPFEIESPLTPLRKQMLELDPEGRGAFLDAAGEERIRRKAEGMQRRINEVGGEQTLYEECMAALGYKHNKRPFRQLARSLPLTELRVRAGGDPEHAYALLIGLAGLMPERPELSRQPETEQLMRRVWDCWFKEAELAEGRQMNKQDWCFAHVRPANHPQRRLMAAAYLFTQDEMLGEQLTRSGGPAKRWVKKALQLLEVNTQTYWTRHFTWDDNARAHPAALIGKPRARAILTNVFVPWLAAADHPLIDGADLPVALPAEPMNSIIRQTAHALFGPDHSASLYKTGLRRQGLIQIFYDFGLGRPAAD